MVIQDIANESCPRKLVHLVPMLMRVIRRGVHTADATLSMPQVGILAFLRENPGSSLSEVSCGLDITSATASSHVEKLVKRKMVKRADHPSERRRIVLTITAAGSAHLDSALSQAEAEISRLLESIPASDREKIRTGLRLLEQVAYHPEIDQANQAEGA